MERVVLWRGVFVARSPISSLSLLVLVRRGGAKRPLGVPLERACVGGGARRTLLRFGAKWRGGGIHRAFGGFGEPEELATEREPRWWWGANGEAVCEQEV